MERKDQVQVTSWTQIQEGQETAHYCLDFHSLLYTHSLLTLHTFITINVSLFVQGHMGYTTLIENPGFWFAGMCQTIFTDISNNSLTSTLSPYSRLSSTTRPCYPDKLSRYWDAFTGLARTPYIKTRPCYPGAGSLSRCLSPSFLFALWRIIFHSLNNK